MDLFSSEPPAEQAKIFAEDADGRKFQKIEIVLDGALLHYYPKFMADTEADMLFEKWQQETDWQQDDIKIFGKIYTQPRLTKLYGEDGKTYTYSNLTMRPTPFPSEIWALKERIETLSTHSFNAVLLNLYRHGGDSNGWHSDDEKELGINPVIASVSLGAKRRFQLKHKRDKKLKHELTLNHGSLLVMLGETQHNWKHQLPKTKKVLGPRINLTYRLIR